MLAPYAAILLEDESLKTIQKDGDITAPVANLLKKWREQRKPEVEALIERLDSLMARHPAGESSDGVPGLLEDVSLDQD